MIRHPPCTTPTDTLFPFPTLFRSGLTTLASKLDGLSCHSMRDKEWQGDIVFLHEVQAGAADRTYGIHVAKMAGLPSAVIARAEAVLAGLEQGATGASIGRPAEDLPTSAARDPQSALWGKSETVR